MGNKPVHYVTFREVRGVPRARNLLVTANQAPDCTSNQDPRRLTKLVAADVLHEKLAGLLIFSQDGRIRRHIAHNPDIEKEYEVELKNKISENQLVALEAALNASVDGSKSSSPTVEEVNDGQVRVVVTGTMQPLKVWQACRMAGFQMETVVRSRIGGIGLNGLAPGQWMVMPAEKVLVS